MDLLKRLGFVFALCCVPSMLIAGPILGKEYSTNRLLQAPELPREITVPHAHNTEIVGLAAAHADRLVGMMHATQCNMDEATQYFNLALQHNTSDLEVQSSAAYAIRYAEELSERLTERALRNELLLRSLTPGSPLEGASEFDRQRLIGETLSTFAFAVKCNKQNLFALEGFIRVRSSSPKR